MISIRHSSQHCPRCGERFTRRCRRRGFVEYVFRRLFVYPFRCQLCGHRFRVLAWRIRYAKRPIDSRENERFVVSLPAVVRLGDETARGCVTAISMNGATIRTEARAPLRALVSLELEIEQPLRRIVVGIATVSSTSNGAISVAFIRLDPAQAMALRALIKRLWISTRQASLPAHTLPARTMTPQPRE